MTLTSDGTLAAERDELAAVRDGDTAFQPVMEIDWLSSKECEALLEHLVTGKEIWERGRLVAPLPNYRRCSSTCCAAESLPSWFRSKLHHVIETANGRLGFQIDAATEALQLVKYAAGDKFDWHMDCGPGVADRKISFSIQLSDHQQYEGGDLEFVMNSRNPLQRRKGTVILFPSFLSHRVTPIESGERVSLVGWVSGPTFS